MRVNLPNSGPRFKRQTAGTVLVSGDRISLCRPTNGFGGYVWTFPKGGMDKHETPEQAAVRETLEETGYLSRLLVRIPGTFASDKSAGTYYVATPISSQRPFDYAETAEVKWFTLPEARQALSLSSNQSGRARDLQVLSAAAQILRS